MYGGMYTAEGKRFKAIYNQFFYPWDSDCRVMCRGVSFETVAGWPRIPLDSKVFEKACELAEIKPSKRQERKWKDGFGKALQFRITAQEIIAKELLAKSVS